MKTLLYSFLGGAIVGSAAAILFAPVSGEDLRKKVKKILKKNGYAKCPHNGNRARTCRILAH